MLKDYKIIFLPKFHLLVILLVVFQFFLWNLLFSPLEFFTLTLIFEIIIIGIPLVTELYKRYNQDFFLKANQLKDRSKKKLQFMLFSIVFVELWIVVFYHFIINYLLQDIFILGTPNVAGIYQFVHYNLLLDINVMIPLLFFLTMIIISIIAMSYFFNHFLKNKMFIYGIMVVFFVIEIIYGPLLNWHFFDRILDGNYIINGDHYNPRITKITLIFIPWNYFVFLINFIVRWAPSNIDMPFNHYFDNTYLNDDLKFIVWYPYVILVLYFILPQINKESIYRRITVLKNIFAKN